LVKKKTMLLSRRRTRDFPKQQRGGREERTTRITECRRRSRQSRRGHKGGDHREKKKNESWTGGERKRCENAACDRRWLPAGRGVPLDKDPPTREKKEGGEEGERKKGTDKG